VSAAAVVGVELAAVTLVCGGLHVLALFLLRAVPMSSSTAEWHRMAKSKIKGLLIVSFVVVALVVIASNGYLVVRGLDPKEETQTLIRSIPPRIWNAIGTGLVKLTLVSGAFLVVIRLLRRSLRRIERSVDRWDPVRDDDQNLASLFRRVDRTIVNLGWILLAVYASSAFPIPPTLTNLIVLAARIYLVVAIGFIVIRSTGVIVGTLDGISNRFAQKRDLLRHYDHLRSLLPTLRACLEYALWIGVLSLVLVQLAPTQGLAIWGPRLIQAIGIFVAGRVLIELGFLEIEHRMLPRDSLADMERRRRATMVPLVRSAFTYAVYFGTAALMLGALGFNPMPFLAGAGLLGLVVGFGAQSLINDVVSGFFILFENIYLVGDIIEAGGASGVVEGIEFRTTRIRDADGRVHIIRNGDMKPVINYSKDFTMAVVTMEVAYDADLPAVFERLRDAGSRLREENRDVLEDTRIDGITAFGASTMTVRTSTRVLPGRHEKAAAALRLLIKEALKRSTSDASGPPTSEMRGRLVMEPAPPPQT